MAITNDDLIKILPNLNSYAKKLFKSKSWGTGQYTPEELVQDTTVRMLEKQQFFIGGCLRSWGFTIMHNEFVNRIRKNAKKPTVDFNEEIFNHVAVDAEQEKHQILINELIRAFEKANLRKEQVEAITRVASNDLTYEEHAEQLNLNISTFRTRLHRGREKLKEVYHA